MNIQALSTAGANSVGVEQLVETGRSAETSVAIDQAAQNNIAQDLHLRQHRSENFKLRTLW